MAEKTAEKTSPAAWPSFPLGAILIFALTLLVYFPCLHGEFLWDDDVMLTKNQHIHAPAGEGLRAIWFSSSQPDYLPLTSTMFWIEWRLWGMNSTGYHVVNVFLHALNSLLLWRVLRQLKILGAYLAAILFAVHPVCVASVAWIAERKNTLSMLFFLLTISAFLRFSTKDRSSTEAQSKRWYWAALGCFALALLSKGSVVMLPMVLLLMVWWQRGTICRGDIVRTIPFFVLSLLFAVITIWFQQQRSIGEQVVVNQLALGEKVAAALWAIGFYLSKAIWPSRLSMIYPQWEFQASLWLYCLPALIFITVVIITMRWWKSGAKHILLIAGYFVLMLFPILGFVNMYFLIYSRVADHWQYLALVGIVSGAAAFWQFGLPRLREANQARLVDGLRWGGPLAVVTVLSLLSWQHASAFASSEKLWADTLRKNPKCWVAHVHLGDIFSERGNHVGAVKEFMEGLELKPDFAEAHYNLANSLMVLGQVDEGITHFTEAIRLKPRYPDAHYNYALALERQGKLDEALAHYLETVHINPAHIGAHNNAGILLARLGRNTEAAEQYAEALRQNPNLPEAYNNFANILQNMGKVEESIPNYLQAIKLQPDYVDARKNLAIALKTLGKTEEAAIQLREVLRLKPDSAEAAEMLKGL